MQIALRREGQKIPEAMGGLFSDEGAIILHLREEILSSIGGHRHRSAVSFFTK